MLCCFCLSLFGLVVVVGIIIMWRRRKPNSIFAHSFDAVFFARSLALLLYLIHSVRHLFALVLHMRQWNSTTESNEINFSLFICFELKFVQIRCVSAVSVLVIRPNAAHGMAWHGMAWQWFLCLRECEHASNQHLNRWDNNFVINLFEIYFLELKSFYVYIHR